MINKFTTLSLIVAIILGLGLFGCEGGGVSQYNEENEGRVFTGISSKIILGECSDSNANFICDNEEAPNNTISTTKRMLLKLQDKEHVNYNDGKFILPFSGYKQKNDIFSILSYGSQISLGTLQGLIYSLNAQDRFNRALLKSFMENLNQLQSHGMAMSQAVEENIEAMSTSLANISVQELEISIQNECNDDQSCIRGVLGSLALVEPILTREEAYALANPINIDLTRNIICEAGEINTVQNYGVEDQHSLSNGGEVASPSEQVLSSPGLPVNLFNYDLGDPSLINQHFAEGIRNLPSNITKGRIIMGLEIYEDPSQAVDTLFIGNYDGINSTIDNFSDSLTSLISHGWQHQFVALSTTKHIYWNDFSNVVFRDATTLLDYVQTHDKFDVYIQNYTDVDFITVATCSEADPMPQVTNIVNTFACDNNETLVKIIGGTMDAFSSTTDTSATPSNSLVSSSVSSAVTDYDAVQHDQHFLETLTLPNGHITKVELNIGYKIMDNPLYVNDSITIGDYATNHAATHLYINCLNPIMQGWNVNALANYGYVAQTDLNMYNTLGLKTKTVFTTMVNNGFLDIYVKDDTAVDFTQLNLCVR